MQSQNVSYFIKRLECLFLNIAVVRGVLIGYQYRLYIRVFTPKICVPKNILFLVCQIKFSFLKPKFNCTFKRTKIIRVGGGCKNLRVQEGSGKNIVKLQMGTPINVILFVSIFISSKPSLKFEFIT